MAMKDVTRREILLAMEEYDRLGQEEFLARHGFRPAPAHRVVYRGRSYDSQAVVGVARRYLAGREDPHPDRFGGGDRQAVDVLERAGFTVVVRTVPPLSVGVLLERMRRVRMSRASGRPSIHQAVVLAWGIGRARRGEERLAPWSVTEREIAGLLRRHAENGERARPDYPVAVLAKAGLWDIPGQMDALPATHGNDAGLPRWFAGRQPLSGLDAELYDTLRDSGTARLAALDLLAERYFPESDPGPLFEDVGLWDDTVADDGPDAVDAVASPAAADAPGTMDTEGAVGPAGDPAERYRWLCALVERDEARTGTGRRATRVTRSPIRRAAARRAVLERCAGRCENPRCAGQPDDVTRRGTPLLEVDHVRDLAGGGRDHPEQMVALCPNCHAVKTRGRRAEELRAVLLAVAEERHRKTLADG